MIGDALRGGKERSAPVVSIVIPTLDEADNVDPLLEAVLAVPLPVEREVIIVDDRSRDGTAERVKAWEPRGPIRLLCGPGSRGLSGAVLHGAEAARGEVVVVMDADLSHPPEAIPALVAPVLEGACDMALGSRYVRSGATPGWPLFRRILSRGAAALAWLLSEARDPLSGYFAVRRERLLEAGKNALGFKVGLEVLARGGETLRVREVPITFRDRERGGSKLGGKVVCSYLQGFWSLSAGTHPAALLPALLWPFLTGVALDAALLSGLVATGRPVGRAHLASGLAGLLAGFLAAWAAARLRKRRAGDGPPAPGPLRLLAFAGVGVLGLLLRGAVLALLLGGAGWRLFPAMVAATAAAVLCAAVGAGLYLAPRLGTPGESERRFRLEAALLILYLLAIRLSYLGLVALIPEESYYWNYAQHLDYGYLDHPPITAWLIWLATAVLGQREIAVRAGALLASAVVALFIFLLGRDLYGKSAGLRSVLLTLALPFFFMNGSLMTPDAPLAAAWAGALWFLARALLRERPRAWYGFGVCLGLGLLSKYTIVLLVPGALLFLLLSGKARRCLCRPEPWLACLVALVLFSPVVIWNALHDWASFAFQGPRRFAEPLKFHFHHFLGSLVLLLSPVGLLAFAAALARPPQGAAPGGAGENRPLDRRVLFARVFTLTPVAVFATFSFFHPARHSWTGPAWLAAIPLVAWAMGPPAAAALGRTGAVIRSLWKPALVLTSIAIAGSIHFLFHGLPGVPWSQKTSPFLMDWSELARQVGDLEREVERETGQDPMVVGLDHYQIASQLAFYDPDGDGAATTTGRHLFGLGSLMYEYWFPPGRHYGENLIVLGGRRSVVESPWVDEHAARKGPIRELVVLRQGAVVGRYFARVVYGYHSNPLTRANP